VGALKEWEENTRTDVRLALKELAMVVRDPTSHSELQARWWKNDPDLENLMAHCDARPWRKFLGLEAEPLSTPARHGLAPVIVFPMERTQPVGMPVDFRCVSACDLLPAA
jgi:hypothetical protein